MGECVYFAVLPSHSLKHILFLDQEGDLAQKKNIITVCRKCHNLLDQSAKREKMLGIAKRYLERIYGNIDKSEVKYAKSK